MPVDKEREMVAAWAITMHAAGDNVGDMLEHATDGIADDVWDLPLSPQQFADKWADTIEILSQSVLDIVLHNVPQEPIKFGAPQLRE